MPKSKDLLAFEKCFEGLVGKSTAAKAARRKQWSHADPNGNGYLSLAEVDGWVQKRLYSYRRLSKPQAERIWRAFRPAYIRAFLDAADAMDNTPVAGANATTDDYVQRGEFHLLCAYLLIYVSMFDAFSAVDGGPGITAEDDRRISLDEWRRYHGNVTEHGFAGFDILAGGDVNLDVIFNEMDSDGRGMVLLKEWCAWLKMKEQEAGTPFGRILSVGDGTNSSRGNVKPLSAARGWQLFQQLAMEPKQQTADIAQGTEAEKIQVHKQHQHKTRLQHPVPMVHWKQPSHLPLPPQPPQLTTLQQHRQLQVLVHPPTLKQLFSVQVPPGVCPGQPLQVQVAHPATGKLQKVDIQVPAGMRAGQALSFEVRA